MARNTSAIHNTRKKLPIVSKYLLWQQCSDYLLHEWTNIIIFLSYSITHHFGEKYLDLSRRNHHLALASKFPLHLSLRESRTFSAALILLSPFLEEFRGYFFQPYNTYISLFLKGIEFHGPCREGWTFPINLDVSTLQIWN